MSALINIYIKRDTLAIMLDTLKKKNENGIGITISVNDTNDQYGHNVGAFVSKTKEERQEGKKRYYIGNGSVAYVSDSGVKVIPRETPPQQDNSSDTGEDLPF